MIPLQIGAADMAFARMNNFSFWLMIPDAVILSTSFFQPGGATSAGWSEMIAGICFCPVSATRARGIVAARAKNAFNCTSSNSQRLRALCHLQTLPAETRAHRTLTKPVPLPSG
jgi:hypothetical protein